MNHCPEMTMLSYLETITLFMHFMYPNNDGVFMDDNLPCHRSRTVRDWFEEHSGDFQRIVWLPKSPDMNPIEHVQDIIKNFVCAQTPSLSTSSQLWTSMQTAWLNIPVEDFQWVYVESMPCSVAALFRANRDPTHY